MLAFAALVEVFEKLEAITSGLEMRALLSDFLKRVPKEDVGRVCHLLLGEIAPEYADINIGMAEKMVLKAIAAAAKSDLEHVVDVFKKKGDIGLAAAACIRAKPKGLKVEEVFSSLHKIAQAKGPGSVEVKIDLLAKLLASASPKEAKYIARIVLGTLRLGAGTMTLLDALAIAFTGSKANKPELEHAYNICPDISVIADTVAKKGLKGIQAIDIRLGRPIQMMLAQRVKSVAEILEHIPGEIAVEEKYDGERVQVHKDGNSVTLFSRRLENITAQFPDVCKELLSCIKAKACIVEGEIVPIDAKGNLLPFQVLMQRRRKYEIEKYVAEIPVCLYLFDLLFLEGKSYIKKPLPERHAALASIVKESKNLQLAKGTICKDIDCIESFFGKALERGCEGILAKSCASNAVYQAGTRGWLWIKWKREYAEEMRDTFDLVVIGAFHGRGKRAGTYGALLCAAYNDKEDRFESFCKLGSGFTDAQLAELPKKFKPYAVSSKPANVAVGELSPDVWFLPKIVVEVIGAEITKSPVHAAGLALRFPRLLRYRPEKRPDQATTVAEIIQIYKRK